MNIEVPLWIIASQWVLTLSLGVLVIIMYRQLGYYLGVTRTGSERLGLRVGEAAPNFNYRANVNEATVDRHFDPKGEWKLLIFADPRCASCERALIAYEQLRNSYRNVHTLVVTNASPVHLRTSAVFQVLTAEVAVVSGEEVLDLYQVKRTPFAYLIDELGVIRGKGVTEDKVALRTVLSQIEKTSIPLAAAPSSFSGLRR